MYESTHLLSLPFELRDMIWTFCSITAESNGLLRCCHQTRDEFTPYCILTEDVERLQTLRIWLDSTYNDGVWLKFDYTWEKEGYYHRAVSQVGDMSDPIIQMFLKIRQVNQIILNLHAPRRGYFVGALFMMLAKANDVYCFMSNMMRDIIVDQPDPELGHVEINFLTESRQPDQTENEAKNFWECRSPKALQEPIRKYWCGAGPMPCFYEYFLISHPWEFPRPPTINYMAWPRKHVHRHRPLTTEMVQYIKKCCFKLRHRNQHNKESWQRAVSRFHSDHCDLQRQIAVWSTESMTRARWTGKRTILGENRQIIEGHWEHIYYDRENLMFRFQFWLDNLPGPAGGHMDMLRLHRFKTMNKCGAGIFARQTLNYPKSGGPYGASTEINRRLAALFDPFSAAHIIEMRNSCPHLRSVEWATAPVSEHTKDKPNEAWLTFYPKGIRYHWDRRNLVEWRLHWKTRNYSRLEKDYKGRSCCNNVLLHQWWECVAYQDSGAVLNELALPSEREGLQWAIKSFPSHPTDSERLVLIRRDRDEYVLRVVRKGCGYMASDYCVMAWRCLAWADYAGENPFFHNNRGFLEFSGEVYSPHGHVMYIPTM
ncbi:hypothetical protein FPOAC2_09333 [Fusarium poae]|uniref:hypothetical protein n=1 Tax=Fusarium poae TaxID=36050 RepID=UPI001CE9A874|nr:hypothetical protein FPOAC1_009393 [Fusarium poae]KAG8669990.1 hypothetical protein FPOAC1_009393 [Fusarium poae]